MQRKISNNYFKQLTFIHADESFLKNIQLIENWVQNVSGDFLHYVSSVAR